ncbi:1-aminocyclopropane-1-carboxylate deaminase/D-cysteine desulfhydrase [Salegentibacter chungangensis]|uniref:1-aminocyclopropane-1-carboxylate deaminase/D-cysteine desulfhydrase n=1 Tax=Salegentibacter chungangensis TaxID=1335724 RepID=A0ABW3NR07_9FLAO
MQKVLDLNSEIYSKNQFITGLGNNVQLWLKREDLLHPEVSGNKFRKLKYNLQQALAQNKKKVLTFGGAFSNHIAATAAAAKLSGLESVGVIRGEELGGNLEETLKTNATLNFAVSQGMKLHFVSRSDYRNKTAPGFIKNLQLKFGEFYLVPEGGTNSLAVKGCAEILSEEDKAFHFVCTSVGTGGTISGIINASEENQQILGFPALKGDFLSAEIEKYSGKQNWELISGFHFGGYARYKPELIEFINNFKTAYGIQLDPVYTGKMLYGIFELARESYFPENSRILAIHTGGLQGIPGMNRILKKKQLPLIQI